MATRGTSTHHTAEEISAMRGLHLRNHVKDLAVRYSLSLTRLSSFSSTQTPLTITKRNNKAKKSFSKSQLNTNLFTHSPASSDVDDHMLFCNEFFSHTNSNSKCSNSNSAFVCSPCFSSSAVTAPSHEDQEGQREQRVLELAVPHTCRRFSYSPDVVAEIAGGGPCANMDRESNRDR